MTSVRHVLRLVTHVYQTVISVMLMWQTSSFAPEHTLIAMCYRIKVCLKVDGLHCNFHLLSHDIYLADFCYTVLTHKQL